MSYRKDGLRGIDVRCRAQIKDDKKRYDVRQIGMSAGVPAPQPADDIVESIRRTLQQPKKRSMIAIVPLGCGGCGGCGGRRYRQATGNPDRPQN